jgi:hypothetical protein
MLAEMTNTQWALIGAGGALFLFGIIAIFIGLRAKGKLSVMRETGTVSVARAAAAAGTAAGNQVELKGVAEAMRSLTSPATNTQCLYYKHKVEGLLTRQRRDSDGTLHTEEDWQTVAEDERFSEFVLRDASGAIQVNPQGAEFVSLNSMNDQAGAYGYDLPEAGQGIVDTVLDVLTDDDRYRHYTRYRTSEWIVPVGRECYVLGSAVGQAGNASIAAGDGKFIVSCKSEEELQKKYTWHYVLWLAFGILSLASGAGLAIFGAMTKK